MSRRKNRNYTPRQQKRIDVDKVDTNETSGVQQYGYRHSTSVTGNIEKARPVFHGENDIINEPITKNEINSGFKIIAFFVTFIIPLIAAGAWYASNIDSDVSRLKNDVKKIEHTTELLTKSDISKSSKIENIENSIHEIKELVKSNEN